MAGRKERVRGKGFLPDCRKGARERYLREGPGYHVPVKIRGEGYERLSMEWIEPGKLGSRTFVREEPRRRAARVMEDWRDVELLC